MKFTSKLWNVGEVSVICIMSVLVLVYSGRDVSSNWRSITTVDHVVDRSLERAVMLWRYVELEYLLLIRFAKPNLCVWGGHIYK